MSRLTEYRWNRDFGMVKLAPHSPVGGSRGYYDKMEVDTMMQEMQNYFRAELDNLEHHYRERLNNAGMSYEVLMDRHDHLLQLCVKRIELQPQRTVLVVKDAAIKLRTKNGD